MWTRMVLILFLAVAPPAIAQLPDLPEVIYPELPVRAERLLDFVPAQWRLEHVVRGHLDDDGHDDALLVLRMVRVTNIVQNEGLGVARFDSNPRMLVAVLGDENGFRRIMVDHALIPRPEMPVFDDYLRDGAGSAITIQPNRSFSVNLHSWASAGTWFTRGVRFTFRYQDGCFRLIGYDDRETHRGSLAQRETSVNYLTGRAWVRSGSASDDVAGPRQWARLSPNLPLCINDVGDGLMFEPSLAID